MGIDIPTLKTERLILRGWQMSDVPAFQIACNDLLVSRSLSRMPYPFTLADAEKTIRERIEGKFEGSDRVFSFAAVLASDGRLIGSCGLRVQDAHQRAELGYWTAQESWGKGYTTEACREVVRFGFEDLGLRRISADYYRRNTASGHVLEKLGFTMEGCQRRHVVRLGQIEDLVLTGMLREEWEREVLSPGPES